MGSTPSASIISFPENSIHPDQTLCSESPQQMDSTPDVSPSPRVKGSKHGFENDFDDSDRLVRPSGVPSWFGSLRSSARGALAPLVQSSSSKSISSTSSRSKCRGRSSSIYYGCTLDDQDSDSDGNNDDYYDEPITSRNGLKENRVRGPRMSWGNIDPSLGGFLPQSYKTVSGSELEPSSPTCASPTSKVEELKVSEAHPRHDQGDVDAEDNSDNTWGDSLSDDHYTGTTPLSSAGAPPVSSSSTLSFIKTYVPSLPRFQDTNSGSTTNQSSGSGFWSIRKLLGSRQYVSLDSDQHEQLRTPDRSDSIESFGDMNDETGTMPLTLSDNHERVPVRSRSMRKMGRAD